MLHKAAGCASAEIIELLIKHGANKEEHSDKTLETPIFCAVEHNNDEAFAALENHNVDMSVRNAYGETLAHRAILARNGKVLRQLISDGIIDVDCQSANEETLLHYSAGAYKVEMTEFLLDMGANPCRRNKYNETPWDHAGRRGNSTTLEVLQKRFGPAPLALH